MIKGYFLYKDVPVSQRENIGYAFHILFRTVKPSRVVEIGTSSGGLTLLLRDLLDNLGLDQAPIWTYDIPAFWYNRDVLSKSIKNGVNIISSLDNIFSDQFSGLSPSSQLILEQFIKSDGVSIVLCDGGSKKDEFRIFSQILKPGDVILAHDYAKDIDTFERDIKGKIWDWMEIQWSDIAPAVESNGLTPLFDSVFNGVAWVCMVKI